MAEPARDVMTPEMFGQVAREIQAEVGKAIVGQHDIVRGVLICLIAGGHVLLEGVPGLGKTSLVRAFARVLDLEYSRIQFTPDLMPADVTGTTMLMEDENGRRTLSFQAGPVFGNLILADEINRATPKTQSALLEAMQEGTVTTAGSSRALPRPFYVLATQNPVEMEGTYPLPEAQLDRFFYKLIVSYPVRGELATIVRQTVTGTAQVARTVANGATLLDMQALALDVPMSTFVLDYAVRLVLATQPQAVEASPLVKRYVRLGASPRGAQALTLAGRIHALLEGRFALSFDDLRAVARDALRHRVTVNFEAETQGITPDRVVDDVLAHVPEMPR
ncbi:MAG: AAA family ATPase [Chloroflexota bacterium]|nr:AAA family ATPase [Chloroflexota bacterium]